MCSEFAQSILGGRLTDPADVVPQAFLLVGDGSRTYQPWTQQEPLLRPLLCPLLTPFLLLRSQGETGGP